MWFIPMLFRGEAAPFPGTVWHTPKCGPAVLACLMEAPWVDVALRKSWIWNKGMGRVHVLGLNGHLLAHFRCTNSSL